MEIHLPKNSLLNGADGKTVTIAQAVLSGEGRQKKNWIQRLLPFLGPAFIASVAYVDPGNFATNIQGGSQFGLMLLWVIVASNIMAILLQTLAAKLGIATNKNLAEHCRDKFPTNVVVFVWIIMELVAMATDLAEFLGAALGFQLLFGVPLLVGGILTAFATFMILGLERYGFRPLEIVITCMVGIIAASYCLEIFFVKPNIHDVLLSAISPRFSGKESIVLAAGILGATVMPHAIYLHSALTQGRIVVTEPKKLRRLFHYEIADISIAMGIAGLINMAMLVMAASTFFQNNLHNIGSIEQAHLTLQPLLGKSAGWIFAIALLASGLSSATVGTSAGQIIMRGFIKKSIPAWIRRLITMAPSLIIIALHCDPTKTLVLSQVILSFGLPFAVIPLVMFTSNKKIMGTLTNHPVTTGLAIVSAIVIIALNVYLIAQILGIG